MYLYVNVCVCLTGITGIGVGESAYKCARGRPQSMYFHNL